MIIIIYHMYILYTNVRSMLFGAHFGCADEMDDVRSFGGGGSGTVYDVRDRREDRSFGGR